MPENVVIVRRPLDRFARRQTWTHQGLGPTGRNLCYCGCKREVGKGRSSTFDKGCVAWWRGHSDMNFIKSKVRARDKGVCALCDVDTYELRRQYGKKLIAYVKRRHPQRHDRELSADNAAYIVDRDPSAPSPPRGFPHFGRRWWEADHIVPVIEGGGGVDFTGYRTLCCRCHKAETAKLAARRAAKGRPPQPELAL